MGPRWRQFSPAERQEFREAFAELLNKTYVNKIDGYNGETIAYTGERSSGGKTEVQTVLTMKNGKKIPVAYRLLQKPDGWKVYDVLIENISLVKNYRTQFQDILNNSSTSQLIGRIRAKAAEAGESHAR